MPTPYYQVVISFKEADYKDLEKLARKAGLKNAKYIRELIRREAEATKNNGR